jgi:hypothetical protein
VLPDIRLLIPKQKYQLSGRWLNRLCDRIYKQTPKEGDGVDIEETKNGLVCHARGGPQAEALVLTYGFQVRDAGGGEYTIAPGIVAGPHWGTIDFDNPRPEDWLYELTTTEDTVAVSSGESIWLHVTTSKTDNNLASPLPTAGATAYTVYSGGGGGGGQGGGGGGGGDSAGAGSSGGTGSDGAGTTGGSGGDGGSNGGGSPGEGSGTAAYGGDGGDGGAGGSGQIVSYTHYDKFRLRARHYNIFSYSFDVSSSKPTSTHNDVYVRLASISGGTITQHHAGTYFANLPTISFIT